MARSRIMPCKDCGNGVSKSAKTCPHCGVRLKGGFLWRLTKVCVVAFFGIAIIGWISQFSSYEPSIEERQEQKTIERTNQAAALRRDFDNAYDELPRFDPSLLLDNANTIVASARIFSDFGETLEKASKSSAFSPTELAEFKSRLISAQEKNLPVLRDAYGPAMRKKLWEHDVTVRTIGQGYRTIEFVGGVFAANKNIKQFQLDIGSQLSALRFTRSEYKWIKHADEYDYYSLSYPSDTDIAKSDTIGILTQVSLD